MSAIAAGAPTARPRMSAWTAFWAFFGGGVIGVLAASAVTDPVNYYLGLDAGASRTSFVWQPFPPVGDPARLADLATFGLVVLFCGLAARRISRTPESELWLPAATAAVAAMALVAQETRSWWCLLAMIPIAVALRFAARTPGSRPARRRRAVVAAACLAVYAALTGLAMADLQRHPLAASGDGTCGVVGGRGGGIRAVCLEVVDLARGRTATVLGVAASDLPHPSPWRLALGEHSIRPGRSADLDVGLRTSCAGVPPGTYTLRQIPLRVRAGGDSSTATIATPVALRKTCGG
ncbi:MAG TPA: hypothetical protein VN615_03970 [Gaiellales bacterium]|nr:hypothetical protein [Gaiellales bacterium]